MTWEGRCKLASSCDRALAWAAFVSEQVQGASPRLVLTFPARLVGQAPEVVRRYRRAVEALRGERR